jgi:hypothetical protein
VAAAFKVLPIAHCYDMREVVHNCVEAVQQSKLPLGLPSASAPSSEAPSLFQLLAWGDAKHCSPLVHACLDQLGGSDALPVVRSVLTHRATRARLDQLASDTLMKLLNVATGLPMDFKVSGAGTLRAQSPAAL